MKKAFTLLELVFVVVVIGILASTVLSRTDNSRLQEAAVQVVSHIRYAQHLAMVDDRYDATNAKWYKERWSIRFNMDANSNQLEAYTIFADKAGTSAGNADLSEVAIDPQNSGKVLSGGITGPAALDIRSPNFQGIDAMNMGQNYGVINVLFSGVCQQSFAFDHLGRPINSRLNAYTQSYELGDLMQTRCEITLVSQDGNVSIAIEPETGYAHIL